MAKIISFDVSGRKPWRKTGLGTGCSHRRVTAYTIHRTVRCAICGAELDPFDVLVDMMKSQVPGTEDAEEKRLREEIRKRDDLKPGKK